MLNTHLRDNLNALQVVTTKGDLAVATASVTLTRLAVGSNGAVLVADSAATPGVRWSSTGKTVTGGLLKNIAVDTTLTAAANADDIYGMYIAPTFAKGAFTGLSATGLSISGTNFGVSGAGTVDNAYALTLSAPTLGTTNWALYVLSGNAVMAPAKNFINDTLNANMTVGLTINQGAADDEILALKSSDVAHGMTGITETDTYGLIKKQSATVGGMRLQGFTTSGAGTTESAFYIAASCGAAISTLKSITAGAAIVLDSRLKNGTTEQQLGADNNLVAIQNYGTTRFIFDAEGSAHADVEWVAFDEHDDLDLLAGLEAEFSVRRKDAVRNSFGRWLTERRKALQENKVVNFYDKGPRAMVNFTRLAMLHTGALRQLGAKFEAQAERLLLLEKKVLQLAA